MAIEDISSLLGADVGGMPQSQPELEPGMLNGLELGINPDMGAYTAIEENISLPPKLEKLIESNNIAEDLSEDELDRIGRRCYDGYVVDEQTRSEWLESTKSALELVKPCLEAKTFPWRGAANIKLPVITDAAIKFAARIYSEIFRDDKVVKVRVLGDDPTDMKAQRAERVGDYMSWQLLEKECEWEADTDKLLHILPVVGHLFRKRYYCSPEKRTKSELCLPDKICINAQATSLEAARRVTHIIDNISQNDVVSNQRSGIWSKVELPRKMENSDVQDSLHKEDYYCFLEQHCWLDLDGDGYEEPYIVTFEKESAKVVRILARYTVDTVFMNDSNEVQSIVPKQIFTDYVFIPSLDGSYYATGFGQLLEPLTRVANTLINQIADSGSLNNLQAGYLSKEVKIISGRERFELGEWKRTTATAAELKHGVLPLPTKEPSSTLFNLLGLILDLTKEVGSVQNILSGQSPGVNIPATTVLALIEQGMKTFNAIHKRLYRSLKREFKQLYCLNYEYLDEKEYFNVLDEQKQISRQDFEADTLDVIPVSDPNMVTDMQRVARAEALRTAIGLPGVDPRPIIENWLEALKVPQQDINKILPQQDPNGVPPHVQVMMQDAEKKMADINIKEQELALKEKELALKERETSIKAFETMSKAIKNLADAESLETGTQLNIYKQFMEDIALFTQQQGQDQSSQVTPPTSIQQPEGPQNVGATAEQNIGGGLEPMEIQPSDQSL